MPQLSLAYCYDRLDGLAVKASASRAEDPGFESRLRLDFSGSSQTNDLKIGTPVAALPGAWCYRVSSGTGRPIVSILWPGEVESLICRFYLSVAASKIVWADPSLRYTRLLLGTNQPNNKRLLPPEGKLRWVSARAELRAIRGWLLQVGVTWAVCPICRSMHRI